MQFFPATNENLLPLMKRFLGWMQVVSACDLALGLLILAYAAFGEYRWSTLRGGLVLTVLGAIGIPYFRSWRSRLENA
jgi:hypothetical protein